MNFRSFKRFFGGGSKPVRHSERKALGSRRSTARLQLETLEDRSLMSTLPAAIVDTKIELDQYNSPNSVYGPQIAMDPLTPNLLVEVHGAYRQGIVNAQPRHFGEMWGTFSMDGGATWSGFQSFGNALTDPAENFDYNYITNVSVAFDRTPADPVTGARTFYVVSSHHNVANTSGALVLNKYTIDPLFGFVQDTTIGNDVNEAGAQVLYRWFNTDPAFNPYIAIDTNEATYVDPVTGLVQTDSLATLLNDTTFGLVPKAIYVTWNSNQTRSNNATGSNIMIAASADGGHNWSTQQFVSNLGIGASAGEPRIVFAQGTPYNPNDPASAARVVGGTMTIAYANGSFARIDQSLPDGGDPAAYAVSAQEFIDFSPVNDIGFGNTVFDADANNNPSTTRFTIPVNLNADGFLSLDDLDVEVHLQSENTQHLLITLTAPTGQVFTLVRNRVDNQGNNLPGPPGITGVDLGIITDNQAVPRKHRAGTFFDLDAFRSITSTASAAPFIGHYRPEGFGWQSLYSRPVANLNGDWILSITDVRNDGTTPLPQRLHQWGLHFTSQIDTNGFGFDSSIVSTVPSSFNNVYPTNDGASATNPYGTGGPVGIGPGVVVAYDNTLGSFSPFQGRLYMAYTSPGVNGYVVRDSNNIDIFYRDPADVELVYSDDNGLNWSNSFLINDDGNDNFSEGNRAQFMPALAVDPVTGSVVVSYYDGRMDAARSRLANSLSVSIDGGRTWSPSVFLNDLKIAKDFLDGSVITIEPIPGQQRLNGVHGFGDRSGLVAYGGHAIPVFGTNYDAGTSRIRTANVFYAAGPRVVDGDMGPVIADFHNPDNPNVFSYNSTFAADGTRRLDGFVVSFDRPIDPASFDASDVTLIYRDPLGVSSNISGQLQSITPLDLDQQHGNIDFVTQPTITFGDDALVIEGNAGVKQAVFKVYVSQPQTVDVVFGFATQDGSALAGQDYVARTGTALIPAGQTVGTFTVDVLGDTLLEGPEAFFVNMTSVTPAMRRWFTFAVGRIIDDEGPRTLTIGDPVLPEGSTGTRIMSFPLVLSTPDPVNPVSVDYSTFDFSAIAGVDYTAAAGTVTFQPGITTAQIDVVLRSDQVVEDNEIFFVQLFSLSGNAVFARSFAGGFIQEDDDFGTRPTLSVSDALVKEGDADQVQATFTVVLSQVQPDDVVVNYTTIDGSATAGQDYAAKVNSLVIPKEQTSATFTVNVNGDVLKEGNETFMVRVSTSAGGLVVVRDLGTATIVDDDGAPVITVGDGIIKEGDSGTSIMQFPVTLSLSSTDFVSVDYATVTGSARADVDFMGKSGTFTFNPGQISGTIDIVIFGDQVIEPGNEKLSLRLGNSKNASLSTPLVTGTIVDDDLLGLTVGDVFVQEGADGGPMPAVFADITVYLNAATSRDVTFTYQTIAVTATNGQDYTNVSGTGTIPAGATSVVIQAPILYDTTDEQLETFQFQITSSTNASRIRDTATISIVDNDEKPDVTVGDLTVREGDSGQPVASVPLYLSFPVNSDVSVTYTLTGGPALPPNLAAAAETNDFIGNGGVVVIPAGSNVTSIDIPIVGDRLTERTERLTIALTAVTSGNAQLSNKTTGILTILDNDVGISIDDVSAHETGGNVNFDFTIRLSSPSAQTITVEATTANGVGATGALAGSDYTAKTQTIVFSPGQTSQTFQVVTTGDTGPENNESFFVNLTSPTGNAEILKGQGAGLIVDDDSAGDSWSISDVTILEGNIGLPQMTFTIFRNRSVNSAQDIRYSTSSTPTGFPAATASANLDYSSVSNAVATIAANQLSTTVVIELTGELLQENNEFFYVVLSNQPTGHAIRKAVGIGTILDDDQQVLAFGDTSLLEGNGFSFATVPVMLSNPGPNNQPYDFLTADGTALDGVDYFGAGNSRIIFTPNDVRNENIQVIGDAAEEGNENFTVNLVTSLGNIVVPKPTANVTIVDDDDVAVYISDVAVVEGTGGAKNAVFTVYLSSRVNQPVDVQFTTLDGSADATDYTPEFNGLVTIPANALSATISIPLTTDNLDEVNETFSVLITSVNGAGIGKDTGVALIVNDDLKPALTVSPGFRAEGDGAMAFTVFSSFPIVNAIDMTVNTSNLLATAGAAADYDALTNVPLQLVGNTTSVGFTVNIHDDNAAEGNEDFLVTLSNATQGATFAAASDRGTISDNEATVTLNIGDAIVKENNNGTVTVLIPVILSNAVNQAVSVFYRTVDDTATAPQDYVAVPGTPSATNPLVIAANTTSGVIQLTLNADGFKEGNEQFFVDLFSAVGAIVAKPRATVTIIDEDSAFGATQFLVRMTPQTGVGTYSYAIGPNINDRVEILTTAKDNVTPGVRTFTPASMTAIRVGSRLVIDTGAAQETVTVASVTATTFTATIANAHDGTVTPFPIRVLGNLMDQNNNSKTGENDTVNAFANDRFSVPDADLEAPFSGPYDSDTLPLIIPGPHFVANGFQTATFTATPNASIPAVGSGGTGNVFNDTGVAKLTVAGLIGQLADLNVHVNIDHPNSGQLILRLRAPNGQVVLLAQQRGSGDNYGNTTFDDQASASVATAIGPYGTVRPEGLLSTYNYLDADQINGEWTLEVEDRVSGSVGTIFDWSLSITTTNTAEFNGNRFAKQGNETLPDISDPIGNPFGALFSKLSAAGLSGWITDVNVTVNLDYANSGDLSLALHAPDGTTVRLASFHGDGNFYQGTIFDDQAPNNIVTQDPFGPFTHVHPSGRLNLFNGTKADLLNGEWVLEIQGASFVTGGILNGWSLDIATSHFTDDVVLNGIEDHLVVIFDRDINPSSFTDGDVLRMMGPAGLINGPFTVIPQFNYTTNQPAAGVPASIAKRAFRIGFPEQYLSGTYQITIGSDIEAGLERQQIAFPASVTSATFSYGGNVASSPLSYSASTTAAQVQAHLQTITGLVGQVAVSGVNGGPYTVTFTGFVNQQVSLIGVSSFTGGSTPPSVLDASLKLDNNFNVGVDIVNGGKADTGVLTAKSYASTTPMPNTTPTPVAIPPNGSVTVNLQIADAFRIVQGASTNFLQHIQLALSITRANDPSLDAVLIAPDGTEIRIFSRASVFSTVTFDDFAATPVAPGGTFSVGTLNPQIPLSRLQGKFTSGVWQLRLTNNSSTGGTLNNWSLRFPYYQSASGLGEPVADQFTTGFRIFTMDATNSLSNSVWTPVGPSASNQYGSSGPVTALAVDPSDPSGNTVYIGAASGGVWKTTNFLTTAPQGPSYIPLTDLGPSNSLNINTIVVQPRNNDPRQSIIFVGTGNTEGFAPGIGLLRSPDGGASWQVIDSIGQNFDSQDKPLPMSSSLRDHNFVGARVNKIVVDPTVLPNSNGERAVYIAVGAGANPGLYRSLNTGKSWTLIRAGEATDVLLAPASGDPSSNGLLRLLYAAFEDEGVYYTTSAFSTSSLIQMTGLSQPNDMNKPNHVEAFFGVPIPVNPPASTPNGANRGRILLATPAKTGDRLRDTFLQNWLYALVQDSSVAHGYEVYVTKDLGDNWTRLQLTVSGNQATPSQGFGRPTNDENIGGSPQTASLAILGIGNYQMTLAIDPNNPNVLYLGGSRLAKVDITTVADAWAVVNLDHSDNFAGGGNFTGAAAGATIGPIFPFGSLNDTGIPPTPNVPDPRDDHFNMYRDPYNPFLTPSTFRYDANVFLSNPPQGYEHTRWANDGTDARWSDFGDINDVYNQSVNAPFRSHELLTLTDPLTGKTRLILGTDQGVFTVVDALSDPEISATDLFNRGAYETHQGIGAADSVRGARNGNLQIAQFVSGAAQPSTLAADVVGALFYGMSVNNGTPASAADIINTGNLNWQTFDETRANDLIGHSVDGNGSWIVTDATGGFDRIDPATGSVIFDANRIGTTYQYIWPLGNNQVNLGSSDFFVVDFPNSVPVSRTTNLLQSTWPGVSSPFFPAGTQRPFGRFAVNPLDPSALVISSNAGRVYRTAGSLSGFGIQWLPIAEPGVLDGTPAQALAFGSPTSTAFSLNDFVYAGTNGGSAFVTTNGGGLWRNISAGLDGSSVLSIIPNPRRGSNEVYAITGNGVYWMADSSIAAPTWVKLNDTAGRDSLFNFTRPVFNNANDPQAIMLAGQITSLAIDWRYQIPDDLSNPSGPKHPVVYVAGNAGVFRSTDKGITWNLYPSDSAIKDVPQEGGFLPNVYITDLDLMLGYLNPQTGSTNHAASHNLLMATTYGRGAFAIRLDDLGFSQFLVDATKGPRVVNVNLISPVPGNVLTGFEVRFDSLVDKISFTPDDVQVRAPDGQLIAVQDVIEINTVPQGGLNPHNLFRITFAPQTAIGNYRLIIGIAPDGQPLKISDFGGNLMNQDNDGVNGENPEDRFDTLFFFQPNKPPTVSDIPNQSIVPNTTISIGFTLTDDGAANQLTLSATVDNPALIASISFNGNPNPSVAVSKTPTITVTGGPSFGVATITITVTDQFGLTGNDSFQVFLNNPPTLLPASIPSFSGGHGVFPVSNYVTLSGTDPDGDPVTFGGKAYANSNFTDELGGYVQVNANTGQVDLTPARSFVGTYFVRVFSTDGKAQTFGSFSVTVSNNAPSLAPIGDIVAHHRSFPMVVTLSGADPDAGENLSYSAKAFDFTTFKVRQLDESLGLVPMGAKLNFNKFKRKEKHFISLVNGRRYFILPNGQFFLFTGTRKKLRGVFVDQLPPLYWAVPSLLHNPPPPTELSGLLSVNGNQLTLSPGSFLGTFVVEATVTDGVASASQTYKVTSLNNTPIFNSIIGSVTAERGQFPQSRTLDGGDADGADVPFLTYSAQAFETESYRLRQLDNQYGLFSNGNYSFNKYKRKEKHIKGVGNKNFFILPSGFLFQRIGPATSKRLRGVFIAALSPSVWVNPALLWNSQDPTVLNGFVNVFGNQINFTPDGNFTGTYFVDALVSDGVSSATQSIQVDVQ